MVSQGGIVFEVLPQLTDGDLSAFDLSASIFVIFCADNAEASGIGVWFLACVFLVVTLFFDLDILCEFFRGHICHHNIKIISLSLQQLIPHPSSSHSNIKVSRIILLQNVHQEFEDSFIIGCELNFR